ncbi:hypothetical protein A3C20_00305 [Candidatus Kaiserbacteria bacterium RIFCSPHIGHO2_02_FULL_55_25]|uniref:Uncharacterized protein n=1 Tax=Candidatus Kaiserbacteria bacterium RIFCSPHIGHO2_02_FULL_55_25 TaxID=1798498 RepID=A0A1F6E568_9BACT|nr:MAG: hypothetical protein A2764_00575 [Candidatus Kaiserbacteria bacterium RIFCSPHIGHO2_01_FULL_55_79]OGG68798.1 MAG: hypothetical protein A3C20_00305 [Candidatus Kaiserbacteria bacterium RIFCSPHIGHO2_02_FULL_55_25]OGG77273.1 MAG: hypothetical protein A3F56_04395 [Candidatus Kaiserbacteria bacterium RIFCSPHIGHO2_12_FULL_55_13]OGG82968.1 MAG: hypothetical protein A3A42_03580 [Candidatus Kaiserbacteria bacterium RIFCSPLOWO2_01_FULL_55_25]
MGKLANISLKFVDIMIGVVLGLGFQWWPNLVEPWQYAAFIFVYIDLVDYWIDYSFSLKAFPPKRELNIMLDVAIIFTMFLYIYSTQLTITYFLVSFGAFRIIDTFSLIRARREYHPSGREKKFVHAWIAMNIAEMLYTAGLLIVAIQFAFSPLMLLGMYIALRLATRIIASLHYKEVYFS